MQNFEKNRSLHRQSWEKIFKKKWLRDHISTIIACTAAWIVLLISLRIQGVEVYLCGTVGSILAILYYAVLNNRMMAYVEKHIYGGKWDDYRRYADMEVVKNE